jgi:pentatricopeptide repeat protein
VEAASCRADALRFFSEAVDHGHATEELLLTAIEASKKLSDKTLLGAVMQQLSSCTSPKVSVAFLRVNSVGPLASEDPEKTMLELYESHFLGVDISRDAHCERLVVEAALRFNRSDVLTRVVSASSNIPQQVSLLKDFIAASRLKDAIRVFQAVSQKTGSHYKVLLEACIEFQDIETMEWLISDATATGTASVFGFNMLVKAHLARGDMKRARAVIKTMRSAGMPPSCVTFNELLNELIKTDVDGAWELISEMRSCGLKPDHVTCSILLKTIQPGSRAVDAERAMAAMGTVMDEVLLSSVCEACIRAGHVDLLKSELRKQEETRSVQVNSVMTFGSMIRAYGFLKDLPQVWRTWREMRSRESVLTSITIGCMTEALATNGDPSGAHELIKELLADETTCHLVNSVVYGSVLKGFVQMKQFNRVWIVYQEMCAAKLEFSTVTFNTLINACAQCGQMRRVSGLLKDMVEQGLEPTVTTYCTIIKGYCLENQLDSAFDVMNKMKTTTDFRPDEIAYNTLLDGCARHGLFARGIEVLEEMEAAGVRPSNFTLSIVVKLANRCNKLAKAFELCDVIAKKYHIRLNSFVFNNLIQACTAHDDARRANDVLERMLREKVRPDARTYTLLLRANLRAKNVHCVSDFLRIAAGLPSEHLAYAFDAKVAQPVGGLSPDLVTEALEGIACQCQDVTLAMQLVKDLRRVPGLRLDASLHLRLTTKAVRSGLRGRQFPETERGF